MGKVCEKQRVCDRLDEEIRNLQNQVHISESALMNIQRVKGEHNYTVDAMRQCARNINALKVLRQEYEDAITAYTAMLVEKAEMAKRLEDMRLQFWTSWRLWEQMVVELEGLTPILVRLQMAMGPLSEGGGMEGMRPSSDDVVGGESLEKGSVDKRGLSEGALQIGQGSSEVERSEEAWPSFLEILLRGWW